MRFFLQSLLSAFIAIVIILGIASLSDFIANEGQINRAVSPTYHALLPVALESVTIKELKEGQSGWTKASAMRVDRRGRCWVFLQAEITAPSTCESRIQVTRHGPYFYVTLPEHFRSLGLSWNPIDIIPVAGQYAAVTELIIPAK